MVRRSICEEMKNGSICALTIRMLNCIYIYIYNISSYLLPFWIALDPLVMCFVLQIVFLINSMHNSRLWRQDTS